MENVSLLAMVGHGTTGTDGIENGNHLRWAFDRRLGFPLEGFRIYRRMSDGTQVLPKKGCVDFIENTTYNAPFGLADPGYSVYIGLEWHLDCAATNYPVVVQNDPAIHPTQLFLKFRKTLRIKFPQMAMYASVRAYYSAGNGIRMQAFNSQSSTPNDPVAETTYTGPANTPTELELRGKGSLLSPKIEFDVIEITMRGGIERICYGGATKTVVQGATWRLISQDPIALPYTHNNYPLQHPRSGQPDGDWLEAKFRSRVRRYDREDFKEMEAVFKALFDDKPAQSMMIHNKVYPAENGTAGSETELEILPADLLVLTAIDPTIARIVGLYFIDKKALAGVAYDYMVEGIWTKDNIWLLEEHVVDFEDRPLSFGFLPYFAHHELVFSGDSIEVVEKASALAQTTRAIKPGAAAANGEVSIYFPEPVAEVQVYASGDLAGGRLAGYRNGVEVASYDADPGLDEQIFMVSSDGLFDHVVLSAPDPHVHKVCYDPEFLGDVHAGPVKYTHVVSELRRRPALPPAAPTGLMATPVPGITRRRADGSKRDTRLSVGLHWDLPEMDDGTSLDKSFVRYLLKRIHPNGKEFSVTGRVPYTISELRDDVTYGTQEVWPEDEQIYLFDYLARPGSYEYQMMGIDIFGRKSKISPPVQVTVQDADYPLPPPPKDVRARYIDPDDPWLSTTDRAWVNANGGPGLAVSWAWPDEYHEQHPDVVQFHIHVQDDWLNMLRLAVESVTDNGDGTSEVVVRFKASAGFDVDGLAGCKLQTQRRFFDIVSATSLVASPTVTTDEYNSTLTVKHHEALAGLPFLPDVGPGTISYIPTSSLYTDYSDPLEWAHHRFGSEPLVAGRSTYEVILSSPPITLSDAEPKAYAQVSVTSDDNRHESRTATPASVVAVLRDKPAPTTMDQRVGPAHIYASFPDVHGNATFEVAWANTAAAYEVLRAVDTALIEVDRTSRTPGVQRDPADYADFLNQYTDPQLRADIEAEVIVPDVVDYDALDDALLQALASLPENEAAFRIIHKGLLDADAVASADPTTAGYTDTALPGFSSSRYFYRVRTYDAVMNRGDLGDSTPPIYMRDVAPARPPSVVHVLGGEKLIRLTWQANVEPHLAEYRIYRTTDPEETGDIRLMQLVETCGLSEHPAPLRITGKAVTLSPDVEIQSVLGLYLAGEYDDTLAPDAQTADNHYTAESSVEGRRISGIDLPNGTPVTVAIVRAGGTPQAVQAFAGRHEFVDTDVTPRVPTYYRVVAIRQLNYEDGQNATVPSQPSPALSAQAYDLTPPAPPSWDEPGSSWVYVDDNDMVYEWTADTSGAANLVPVTRIRWIPTDPTHVYQVQRRRSDQSGWETLLNWEVGTADPGPPGGPPLTEQALMMAPRILIDKTVMSGYDYVYRIKAKSAAELVSSTSNSLEIGAP